MVGDISEESEDEVNKDLLLLAMQQEKLITELRLAYAEEEEEDTDERRAKRNEEMEARMKAINAGRPVSLKWRPKLTLNFFHKYFAMIEIC